MASLFTLPASLLFGFIGIPLANGAMIWAVSQSYLGEPVSFDSAWRHSIRRALPLIGTGLLYSLALLGGTLLCIIPGILFFFWFILYAQTVMLEGLSGSAALTRSKTLMKGNMGKAFVLLLLISVISSVIGSVQLLVPQPHIAVVVQVALQAVVVMFTAAAMSVFYFSCRCQHEDFDLMRLAESVETHDDPDASNREAAF